MKMNLGCRNISKGDKRLTSFNIFRDSVRVVCLKIFLKYYFLKYVYMLVKWILLKTML